MLPIRGTYDQLREELRRAEREVFIGITGESGRRLRELLCVDYLMRVRTSSCDLDAELPFPIFYNRTDLRLEGQEIPSEAVEDSVIQLPTSKIVQPTYRLAELQRYGILVAQYCAQRGAVASLEMKLGPHVGTINRRFLPEDADYTCPDELPLLTPTGIVMPMDSKEEA